VETLALRFGLPLIYARAQQILRQNSPILAAIFGYTIAGVALAWTLGLEDRLLPSLYAKDIWRPYFHWLTAFAIGYPLYVMLFVRPQRLARYLFDDLRENYLTFERLFAALIVLASFPLFASVFTSLKIMIPAMHPFDWDVDFAALDRWLHGGIDPWRLLHPVLGHPWITTAINAVYHLWYFVIYTVFLWQAFRVADPRTRMQFLVSFILIWALLGNLMATLFASAGPCYFGLVTGVADPFAPLMDYLRAANEVSPVWALGVQDYLWNGYEHTLVQRGQGISAMPSLHVSAAVLMALVGWRTNRVLGILLTGFALAIFIGSVHLGWHYAIDGYAAALGTLAIWHAVGWGLRRGQAT